jgi:E3 ubiquitin-protein ligase RAD18
MLKDGPLRKKLTDQGLSATGSRTLMIQRYTEWITLWNANCDATKPKSKGELKREMEVWERTQGGRAPSSGISHISGAQIRDKDFDGAAWSSKHDGDFQMLIANARRKAQVKPSTSEPPLNQHDSSTVTDPASGVAASPSSAAVDTEMINVAEDHIQAPQNNLPLLTASQEASPAKRRFFLESNNPRIDAITAPSSQHQSSVSADKESGMASDITTPRPIQP